MAQSSQASPKSTPIHPMPIVLGVVFCALITTGVTGLRLIIAGHQKITENGVTNLSYRWEHVAGGVLLGLATYAVYWLLSGGNFTPTKTLQDGKAAHRSHRGASYIVVLSGIMAFAFLSSDLSMRLDSDGISARTLLGSRSVAFADVQRVAFTEEHRTDRKGRKQVSYGVEFDLKSGDSMAWPAGSLFEVEKELRAILERRGIALVDHAPGRQPVIPPPPVPEPTEAEKAAAFAEYERNVLQTRSKAEHEAIRGSEWRYKLGERSTFETTLQFSDDNAITVERSVHFGAINETRKTTHRATYESAELRYRFTFEDGSILEAEIKISAPNRLSIRKGAASGEAASEVLEWFKTSLFQRWPPQAEKAPE